MSDNRIEYARILKSILSDGASFSDIKNTIDEPNKGFFNMLFMTAFRQLTFIKAEVLPQFVKKKIPHKQQILEFILYLAATELLFLDTPDYAVINSYVEAAKKATDKFGANFINAVLRNIARNKDALLAHRKSKFFSADFIKILKQDYTATQIAEMEEFANIEPPLDLTLKHSCSKDIDCGVVLPTGSVRMPHNTKITQLKIFQEGNCWAQDAASALAVQCLSNLKGKRVLDICAAPGGKTAQLLDGGAIVTAVDISDKRLDILKQNITRLNLADNLNVICADALKFYTDNKFDIILLDAPCSATGTFRRHPEIMNMKKSADVKKQAGLQKDILNHIVNFLTKDGIIVYATCSLSKLEGELQIKEFLKQHAEFSILPISLNGTEQMQTKEGFLRVLPQHLKDLSGIDGFFIAVLKRKI